MNDEIYTFEHQRQFVGPGWQPLIELLHRSLEIMHPGYKVHQIKEKFGALRYYTDIAFTFEQMPEGLNPMEQMQWRRDHRDAAYALIEMAEEASQHICEECGKAAKTVSIRGWYRTLCEEDAAKAIERRDALRAELRDEG